MRQVKESQMGKHPNSLANLRPRKKGDPSLNPKGRPRKELSLTHMLRQKLTDPCPFDPEGRRWLEYIVDRWLSQAAEQPVYFRELIERLEGKVTIPVGGSRDGEVPALRITVVSEHDRENLQRVVNGERT